MIVEVFKFGLQSYFYTNYNRGSDA